jgi:tetratricopeptide (TPR) repeat protein
MVPEPGHLWERQSLLLKGLSLSPDNAELNMREAELLAEAGRFHEALAYGRRAASLDPLDPVLAFELSGCLVYEGRLAEARSMIDKAARLWPDDEYVRITRISTEARYGDPDRALALIADPSSRPVSWEASNFDEWRRFIDTRKSRDPAKLAQYARDELAGLAAGKADLGLVVLRLSSLGAIDATFEAASRSTPAKPLDTGVLFRPPADGVRRDPRFMPLMEKVGLVAFWRRTGKWADFCDAPDRPYDCRAVASKLESAGAPRT